MAVHDSPVEDRTVAEGSRSEFSWQHPARSIRVTLSPDVASLLTRKALSGLRNQLAHEVGGILVGQVSNSESGMSVTVSEAKFVRSSGPLHNVAAEDEHALATAVACFPQTGDLRPVGCFRSHVREGFSLGERDQGLVLQHLAAPGAFCLLLRPYVSGACMAGFFFEENGTLETEYTQFEVPLFAEFDGGASPAEDVENKQSLQPAPEQLPEDSGSIQGERSVVTDFPMALPIRPSRWKTAASLTWRSVPFLLLVCALSALAWVGIPRIRTAHPVRLEPSRPLAVQENTGSAQATPLGLHIRRATPDEVDVVWNAPVSGVPAGGQLEIEDGSIRRTLALDPAQVRSGRLPYFPLHADLLFQLNVLWTDGHSTRESIRVIGAERPVMNKNIRAVPASARRR